MISKEDVRRACVRHAKSSYSPNVLLLLLREKRETITVLPHDVPELTDNGAQEGFFPDGVRVSVLSLLTQHLHSLQEREHKARDLATRLLGVFS